MKKCSAPFHLYPTRLVATEIDYDDRVTPAPKTCRLAPGDISKLRTVAVAGRSPWLSPPRPNEQERALWLPVHTFDQICRRALMKDDKEGRQHDLRELTKELTPSVC